MIESPQLHAIATGRATIEEAASALEAILASEVKAEKIYGALRDWTWKALHSRRLDDELIEWLNLIKGVKVRLSREDEDGTRARLDVLAELVAESIRYAANVSDDELANYSHVQEILRLVQRLNGHISRQALKGEMNLGDARLSQLLTLLVHNGLLEREPRGREAHFALTRRGSDLLERCRGHLPAKSKSPLRRQVENRFHGAVKIKSSHNMHGIALAKNHIKISSFDRETGNNLMGHFKPQSILRSDIGAENTEHDFPLSAEQNLVKETRLDTK